MASENPKLSIQKAHHRHSGAVKNYSENTTTVAEIMAVIQNEGIRADITVEDTAELQFPPPHLRADGN